MRTFFTLAIALAAAAFCTTALAQTAPAPAAKPAAERKDPRDLDGDHRASWDEYRKAMSDNFTRLDKNGDGVLESAELPQQPAPKPGQKLTRAQFEGGLRASFDHMDKDKDGFLAGAEFPETGKK
ncbi:MAG TPA: hypothetical protein VJ806_04405 [Luteimonas sp.]|nr:hypothetical protein [Luteimonas sp.]